MVEVASHGPEVMHHVVKRDRFTHAPEDDRQRWRARGITARTPEVVVQVLPKDNLYVLNQCTKYLARTNTDARHDYGQYDVESDPRARVCESWRFPIVDSYNDGVDQPGSYAFNRVTFVFVCSPERAPSEIGVVGTFASLYAPVPLEPVLVEGSPTRYVAATVKVPKGEVHTYKFVLDGRPVVDPLNPQRAILDNGETWSRFFTQLCTQPITFERWEMVLLARLTEHILPFRTNDGQRFVDLYYQSLDQRAKDTQFARAYRLDQNVGVANYIDKAVAREEAHHLVDYRICLRQIDRLLRQRNPFQDPAEMPRGMYVELYDQMAVNAVPGWDYGAYQNPRYFLQLLRRHCITGAFAHPKYGGNAGAAGWAYLEDRYRTGDGDTLFNWRKAIERPLGESLDYNG